MTITAAEALIEIILENGIQTVFGYPGGAVVPLYDALYYHQERITHIRTAHEQGAVFAADGYARISGLPGVCIATSGPGATNLLTGIASAFMDSVPLVAITGQAPTHLLGRDAFQEIDITAMTLPITKHNYALTDATHFVETVREAFKIAKSGRPGPVHIDIPRDVFLERVEYEPLSPHVESAEEPEGISQEDQNTLKQSIQQAALAIQKSKRPVILAGGGIARGRAEKELFEFVEKAQIPIAFTLMGISTFPSSHPLSLGFSGMHGHSLANLALKESDLIIAIGVRFSDRNLGQKDTAGKTIIQMDIDETEVGKNIHNTIAIHGHVGTTLPNLTQAIFKASGCDWIQRFKEDEISQGIPEELFKVLNKAYADAIVVTDVGQHQMWTAQYWSFKSPSHFITSGGLGAMGYGLGAAIGVKVADLQRGGNQRVVLVTGDGSFKMNLNELSTLKAHGIDITIIMINNGVLGMVRQLQSVFTEGRFHGVEGDAHTDYCALTRAFGMDGFKVSTQEELQGLLAKTTHCESLFIEIVIERSVNVIPMVRPGGGIGDLIYL